LEIIKLNATDSTNSFLKSLLQNSTPRNFTVVVTTNQTKGRGQLEKNWNSEPHKNLTFSVFISFKNLKIIHQKYLNFAVSQAIHNVLLSKNLLKTHIKWPNDILSANKKICGILIENTFFGENIKNAIVGIGLNVNQEKFPESINNPTSLKLETSIEFDLEKLLKEILIELEEKINLLELKKFKLLEENYLNVLYKKDIPSMFKNNNGDVFMGIISGISNDGKLQIKLEDNSTEEYGIKEVSFL
jgi:BirA family biotin operon repressor/biotin-[acetyl-CoA-carboxylase] ligase